MRIALLTDIAGHCPVKGRVAAPSDWTLLRQTVAAAATADADAQFVILTTQRSHGWFEGFERVCVSEGGRVRLPGTSPAEKVLKTLAPNVLLWPFGGDMPLRGRIPTVLYALDLFPWVAADAASVAPPVTKTARASAQKAQVILCPSNALQKQVAISLGIGMDKIVVAQPGVSPVFSTPQQRAVAGDYAVFPVNRHTLPCLGALRDAMEKRPEFFPPVLVVLGAPWSGEPANWGREVIRVERCPENIRASLMQHARMLLYTAVHDGAGVPVMEALCSGVPVLASKSCALGEIGGRALLHCDPQNSTSIIQTLRRFHDESAREQAERIAAGRSWISDVTWDKCAWKVLSAVKRAL